MAVDGQSHLTNSRWGWIVVSLLCCALQQSLPAWAQDAPTTTEAREEARERYEQGAHAYSEGRYEDAILHFEAAYALEPAGALLLNIAQANRLKVPANCEAALRHYELYLAADPRAPERVEVQGHINRMRQCQAEANRAAATANVDVQASAPAKTRPSQSSTTPLWLAGSGGAVLFGGGVMYTVARLRFNALKGQCRPCSDETIDRWQAITNVSYAALAVGAFTTVAGLAWWRWSESAESPKPLSLRFSAVPSAWIHERHVGLSWQGRF